MRPCKPCLIRVQECWKSCTNGSNIVALRFSDHGTKEMLHVTGSNFDRFQTLRKYSGPNNTRAQQHATGCANGRNV